jgi:hypothetical protein
VSAAAPVGLPVPCLSGQEPRTWCHFVLFQLNSPLAVAVGRAPRSSLPVDVYLVSAVKDCSRFYGPRKLITVLTRAGHWSLSRVKSIQPTSKIHRNISAHLRPGLPSGLFPSGFPTNELHVYAGPLFPIRATCSAHALLESISLIVPGEQYELRSSTLPSPNSPLVQISS